MAHAAAHAHDDDHGGHHLISKRDLLRTISILVVLTVVTVGLALLERYFETEHGLHIFGPFSVPIALAIALTKAYFVASYFMGLKYDGGTNLLAFVGSVVFLLIFLSFTYLDTGFRDTFEERSAIPVDEINAEVLEANAASESIQDEFKAVPLVRTPDAGLFPNAAAEASQGATPADVPAAEAVADSTAN